MQPVTLAKVDGVFTALAPPTVTYSGRSVASVTCSRASPARSRRYCLMSTIPRPVAASADHPRHSCG